MRPGGQDAGSNSQHLSVWRITEHPILGRLATGHRGVCFQFDGKAIHALEGEPIAAALAAAGIRVHRYSPSRLEPRGVFCGIGQCTDCAMIVNGVPNVRTCVTQVEEGMEVETQGVRDLGGTNAAV